MDHFRRMVDDPIAIAIKPDSEGSTGRECPKRDCEAATVRREPLA